LMVGDPVINNVPEGRNFKIKLEHDHVPLSATTKFEVGDTARFMFAIGQMTPANIVFESGAFDGWFERSGEYAYYLEPPISGGLNNCGSPNLFDYDTGPNDTCTSIYGYADRNYYYAEPPSQSSCVVHITAKDCDIFPVEFQTTVQIQSGGTPM
jgi:hypothetical protein